MYFFNEKNMHNTFKVISNLTLTIVKLGLFFTTSSLLIQTI